MTDELFREGGTNSRVVRLRMEPDRLVVETQDLGPLAEEMWGDTDYEFWTSVSREHWGALAAALVKELLAKDPQATDRLREICRNYDVPHEWDSWT